MAMGDNEFFDDFCSEMRKRSQIIHDQSDKLVNLKLTVVLTDTHLWAEAISQFYYVFQAIEECLLRYKDHPLILPIHAAVNDYRRTKAFEADLQFYLGSDWQKKITQAPATKLYCERVCQAADNNPALLIAYIHSMYLALLAGGQIIKRIVRRSLGLSSEDHGLAIFDFGVDSEGRRELKRQLLESINQLGLTRDVKEAIIEEKWLVFRMNNAIVNSVHPTWSSYRRLALAGIVIGAVVAVVARVVYVLLYAK